MKKKLSFTRNQAGFTLVETIIVLALIGLLASIAGLGLAKGVQGYLLASENAAVSQKAQLAMTRLTREIMECFDCGGTAGAINLPYSYENHLGNREISLDATDNHLLLGDGTNERTLVDQVKSFTLYREDDGRITMKLTMGYKQGSITKDFEVSVLPRNL